jgi:poly-beta-1,6-N-acetyl-D-glucosamine synthase
MIEILFAWFFVAGCFAIFPCLYFFYMKGQITSSWNLKIDENYIPSVAILVPVHNEAKTIRFKLENLRRVQYPAQKMEIIIVNDASKDNTMKEISQYMANNPSLVIKIFSRKEHLGKVNCLNRALKSVNADVVIISDADCFWSSDILQKALPYLSDPKVGAITARELLLNNESSWVTLGEKFYDSFVQAIRIGESKIHSTIFFQGGFAAFKRNLVSEFNETDDSGTALDIVQQESRSILIPEIGFYTTFPATWTNKIDLKIRRASQLQHLWAKCLNLLIHGNLKIPKKIAIPEIFMHVFNPLLLFILGFLSIFVFIQYPYFFIIFVFMLSTIMMIPKAKTALVEAMQSNFILLIALTQFFSNKTLKFWKTNQESRIYLTEKLLKDFRLV